MSYLHGFEIEVAPPALDRWAAGNAGVPFYWSFESRRAGPHLLINAITHGDELCGAIAVDRLLTEQVRPMRGKLTLGFANVEAFRRWDTARPNAGFFIDDDMNRVWDSARLAAPGGGCELRRAREMRALIDDVDLLLDIHSTQYECEPMLMAGWTLKARGLAESLGFPALVVTDFGHEAGTRLGDYAAFADEASAKNALVVECGQHWRLRTTAVALESALVFLEHHEMIEPMLRARLARPMPLQQRRTLEVTHRITVSHDDFRFERVFADLEVIAEAGTVLGTQGGSEIRTPYDDCILIMPVRKGRMGTTAVRLARRAG